MTAQDPQPGSYALGRTDDERERLVAQATLFDRTTERYLREAGLAPGMRVLDLGTGGVAASPPLIGAWARVR
jgi:hypothetical protein